MANNMMVSDYIPFSWDGRGCGRPGLS
jgi:hypothetical protein